jgi:hypothetical protein
MLSIASARRRRLTRSRTWLSKLWAFLNTTAGATLLTVVLGGLIVKWAVVNFESTARERELAVASAQEAAKLRAQLRVELFRERDRDSRSAFRVIGALVTAAEDLMRTEEKAW